MPAGTSEAATAPIVTLAPFPTFTSLETVAFGPTQTSSPITADPQTQAEAARFGMNTWTAERATLEAMTECLQNAAYELRNKEREAMI